MAAVETVDVVAATSTGAAQTGMSPKYKPLSVNVRH